MSDVKSDLFAATCLPLITVFAFPTTLRAVFTTGEVTNRYYIHTLRLCLNIQQILACGGEVS